MQKNKYSIPLISDLFDLPQKIYIYTKIDLHHIYYLVYIAENNEWKTTFYTCYRFFKWEIISFALTNTPATFFINNDFSNLLNICVVVYLNNILIYLDNMFQYQKHIKKVLH